MFGEGAGGEEITTKYELLGTGTYSSVNTHIQDAIFGIDPNTPRELFEARNAVRIAHIAAADKYAPSIIAKADQQLKDGGVGLSQRNKTSGRSKLPRVKQHRRPKNLA